MCPNCGYDNSMVKSKFKMVISSCVRCGYKLDKPIRLNFVSENSSYIKEHRVKVRKSIVE